MLLYEDHVGEISANSAQEAYRPVIETLIDFAVCRFDVKIAGLMGVLDLLQPSIALQERPVTFNAANSRSA